MQLQIDNLGKVAITIEKAYWSATKDYDKLTVVEVEGQYKTFVSRKPVPAGTSVTDRNYWIPFSSLKEEIVIAYNKWVNTYGGLLTSLVTVLNGVQTEVNDLYTHMAKGITFSGDKEVFEHGTTDEVTLSFYSVNRTPVTCKLYKNNVLIKTYSNVTEWTEAYEVDSDTEFKVEADQGGYTYTASWNVGSQYPFYGGSGNTYTDVVNTEHKLGAKYDISGLYTIEVTENGQSFFFVVPNNTTIVTMKMNGLEVPCKEVTEQTIDGIIYKVYESANTYVEGTYLININGYATTEAELVDILFDRVDKLDEEALEFKRYMDNPPVDNETISVNEDSKIALADKAYEPEEFSGLGRVYLKKNVKSMTRLFDGTRNAVTVQSSSATGVPDHIWFDETNHRFVAQFGTKYYASWSDENAKFYMNPGNYHSVYQDNDGFYVWDFTTNTLTSEGAGLKIGNVLTQDMISEANTIYHIQYDFDLNEETITIPEGCVLEFEGGSLRNGSLILGTGTNIISEDRKIFYNIAFEGNCKDIYFHIDWFVNNYSNSISNETSDATQEIQTMFDSGIKKVWLTNNHCYRLTASIVVDASIIIDGKKQRYGYDSSNTCKYIYGSFDAPFFIIKPIGTVSGVTISNLYLYRKEISGSLTRDNEYKKNIPTLYFDCSEGDIWGLYFNGILECSKIAATYYTSDDTQVVANFGGHRAIEISATNGHWLTYIYLRGYINYFHDGLKISKDSESGSWITGVHLFYDSRTIIGGECNCSIFLSGEHQPTALLPYNNEAFFTVIGTCNIDGGYVWDTSFTSNKDDKKLYTVFYSIKAGEIYNADSQHDIFTKNKRLIKNNLTFALDGNAALAANLIPPIFYGMPVNGVSDCGIKDIVFKVFSTTEEYDSYIQGDIEAGTNITRENTYGYYNLFYPDKFYYDNAAGSVEAFNYARKSYVRDVPVKIIMFECKTCFLERASAVVFQYSKLINSINIKNADGTRNFTGSAYFNPIYCEITSKSATDLLRITIEYKNSQTNVDIPYIGICGPGVGVGCVGSWGGSVAGLLHIQNLKSGISDKGIKVSSSPLMTSFNLNNVATLKPFLHIKANNVRKPLKVVINNGGNIISLYTGFISDNMYYPVYVYGNLRLNQDIKVLYNGKDVVFCINYILDLTIESIECGDDFTIIEDLDTIDTTGWTEKGIKIQNPANIAGLITKRPAITNIYAGFMYLVTQAWENISLGTSGSAGPYYYAGANNWILADGTIIQDDQMPIRN